MVELLGVDDADGPRKTYPAEVCPVTVRLPVTATAADGTPPRPLTWNARGTVL